MEEFGLGGPKTKQKTREGRGERNKGGNGKDNI